MEIIRGENQVTLEELLSIVPDPGNQLLPTAKSLINSEQAVLFSVQTNNVGIFIYTNGYYVYKNGRSVTVQNVHRCKKPFYYQSVMGRTECVGYSTFAKLPFQIRLSLEGEKRLEINQMSRNEKWITHFENSGEPENQNDYGITPDICTEQVFRDEEWDEIERLLLQLTDRQKTVLTKHVFEGMAQSEIAAELGISRQTVNGIYKSAI